MQRIYGGAYGAYYRRSSGAASSSAKRPSAHSATNNAASIPGTRPSRTPGLASRIAVIAEIHQVAQPGFATVHVADLGNIISVCRHTVLAGAVLVHVFVNICIRLQTLDKK
jgi:hypothetical protein